MVSNIQFPIWVNAFLAFLQKHDWRGKHKFYLWLTRKYPHKVIGHKIGNRDFFVPVGEWCFWLEKGPENYYLDEFLPFCQVINQLNHPFVFFDLGADIGTVTSLVARNCPTLSHVIAFEPNPKSFDILLTNLAQLTVTSVSVNAAVSDYNGTTAFHADSDRLNDHEGYIESGIEGDTQVFTLDDWSETQDNKMGAEIIVLKIDVEGQEIQTLKGATRLIKAAKAVILLIEVHPDVLRRTNNTADELFEAAELTRDFIWQVPLCNGLIIDRTKPLFQQIPEGQYDIIGVTS
ncbi:MAG: FkbM family methyltransferase [Paraglaciecola sp.]|uniref:FkbM family methyltransferase n=1 Tax=Paraglaciecola sp. TaxID=1920173 RepID=UPI00329A2C2C